MVGAQFLYPTTKGIRNMPKKERYECVLNYRDLVCMAEEAKMRVTIGKCRAESIEEAMERVRKTLKKPRFEKYRTGLWEITITRMP